MGGEAGRCAREVKGTKGDRDAKDAWCRFGTTGMWRVIIILQS
jgi:hypothetical protein